MKKLFIILSLITFCASGCGTQQPKVPEANAPASNTEASVTTEEVKKTEQPATEVEQKEVVIYLTRHGKTMLNTSDRVQGWSDSPLTEPGVEIAQYLGKGLALEGIKFNAAYSSDSGRSIETANIVLKEVGQDAELTPIQLKDLREWNFGKFEGDFNDNMLEEIIEVLDYKGEEDVRTGVDLPVLEDAIAAADETGTAENWEQGSTRIARALETIINDAPSHGGGNILVVAHGLTINTILRLQDPEMKTVPVPNAAVAKIKIENGKPIVETVNDVSYIEKGKQ